MIEKGLILTGNDADLLSRALSEVKTKVYQDSEAQLDDTQALDALVSCFRNARMTVRKAVIRILAPYVSVWCSARLSI